MVLYLCSMVLICQRFWVAPTWCLLSRLHLDECGGHHGMSTRSGVVELIYNFYDPWVTVSHEKLCFIFSVFFWLSVNGVDQCEISFKQDFYFELFFPLIWLGFLFITETWLNTGDMAPFSDISPPDCSFFLAPQGQLDGVGALLLFLKISLNANCYLLRLTQRLRFN